MLEIQIYKSMSPSVWHIEIPHAQKCNQKRPYGDEFLISKVIENIINQLG